MSSILKTNQISWWRTTFGEEEVSRLAEAVSEEHVSQGPVTKEFEDSFAKALDMPYAVATTSGSVALLIALMACGIGRGDEVIVPNRTWVATAHAALMLGAEVTLVDVEPEIPIIDVEQIRSKITRKTKAIMPVHLNGRSANMVEIRNIAKEHNLHVVEDSAQSMFSKNQQGFLGTQSDIGCFSLSPAKLISTGQGGIVVTKNRNIYDLLKLVANHGVVDNFTDRWIQLGFNFKFTDLQASFGIVQLRRSEERIDRLHEIYSKYSEALQQANFPFIKLLPVDIGSGALPLYIEVLCSERSELMNFLSSEGIQIRPSLPSLDTSDYLNNQETFPNSKIFNDQAMVLPCGPDQPMKNIDKVIESLYKYASKRS